MRIRDAHPSNRKDTGVVCACLWVMVLGDVPMLSHTRAQAPAGFPPRVEVPPPASFQTTVVQGAVAQYLMNPDGVVDGLLLENNAVVRFPPHLGRVLAETVRPQDVVRVEGAVEVPGTIHASSIVNLRNQRAVVDAPPSPKHTRPGNASRQPLSAHGTIRVLTHAKHGEVDGAVLADGTFVHFPPHAGSSFAALLAEGNPLAATGYGTSNEYGRSLEAEAMGPSLDRLQTIAPGASSQPSEGATTLPSPRPHP